MFGNYLEHAMTQNKTQTERYMSVNKWAQELGRTKSMYFRAWNRAGRPGTQTTMGVLMNQEEAERVSDLIEQPRIAANGEEQRNARLRKMELIEKMLPCPLKEIVEKTGIVESSVVEYLKMIRVKNGSDLGASSEMLMEARKVIAGRNPYEVPASEIAHILAVTQGTAAKAMGLIRRQYDLDPKSIEIEVKPKRKRLFHMVGDRLFIDHMDRGEVILGDKWTS